MVASYNSAAVNQEQQGKRCVKTQMLQYLHACFSPQETSLSITWCTQDMQLVPSLCLLIANQHLPHLECRAMVSPPPESPMQSPLRVQKTGKGQELHISQKWEPLAKLCSQGFPPWRCIQCTPVREHSVTNAPPPSLLIPVWSSSATLQGHTGLFLSTLLNLF